MGVEHFYRFEKRTDEGGHLVLPHGSGYLVPADCQDELPGEGYDGGLIGARWSLPMFGMVKGDHGLCAIVDAWWDCAVAAEHTPGEKSALDFSWVASLGSLSYARRFLLRFEDGMDYVWMAKRYREYARKTGCLRTLSEKAGDAPQMERDVSQVLFRWPAWNSDEAPKVLSQVRALRKERLDVRFFFPKWPASGFDPELSVATKASAGWQGYLLDEPVPGGWKTLVDYATEIRELGCTLQFMINMRDQEEDAPEFDDGRWAHDADGQTVHSLSGHDAMRRLRWVLGNVGAQGLPMDVLYYDGYSAFYPLREDWSVPHYVTRRETFAIQNACFAETRRRGILPAAELARFWCIPDCDFFFFTDWSSDRLANVRNQYAPAPVGEPIPLFQLVFHDCYIAGFSGGGYAAYAGGYDWWEDRTPRLYELMYGSSPSYNWLPGGGAVPIPDTDDSMVRRRLDWLRRWSSFYRGIALSEMTSHRFLSDDRRLQRVEFANGAYAEFDMSANRFRVSGVAGFDGKWEEPPELTGTSKTNG